MYGLEGGIRKRAAMYLAGCLPYLWRTVKYEEVYIHEYASPREARQALTRYFAFYNQQRPHQALDYLTPAEVYFHTVTAGQRQNE
jgi:transposase InsO family protein